MKIHGKPLIGPGGATIPLSPALETGGLVFVSGQLALVGGRVEGDITTQTEVTFDAIQSILEEAGLGLDHVIKTTIWLTDPADFAAFNAVYAQRLPAPFPARSCVISQLVLPDARVEIEVVASREPRRA
ncbi:RidA family protein [Brevundimonas sp.]|uniref:RidA family protein n=1 Tax=Brevundimonas sp. TaxID=1871086 RepID=UPI003567941E